MLAINYHNDNEANEHQSLKLDENQAEQAAESLITHYKDVLYSLLTILCSSHTVQPISQLVSFWFVSLGAAHTYTHSCHVWDTPV